MSFNKKKHGHIYWTYFHMEAANAITPRLRELMVWKLYAQAETFPCLDCRGHFAAMLADDPPEIYSNTNVSLFRYTWKLHDNVNKRLNVPENKRMSYEDAFAQYFGDVESNIEVNILMQDGIRVTEKESDASGCKECGPRLVENVKPDLKTSRDNQRIRYASKNSSVKRP